MTYDEQYNFLKKACEQNILIYDSDSPGFISHHLIGHMLDYSLCYFKRPLLYFYTDNIYLNPSYEYKTVCGFKIEESLIHLTREFKKLGATMSLFAKKEQIILGVGEGVALLGCY